MAKKKPKKPKPANPIVDRLGELLGMEILVEETSVAVAALATMDERGKELVQDWMNQLDYALSERAKIYALRSDAAWKMAKLLGETNLREQVLLRDKEKAVKKLWRERPGLLK